MSPHLSLSELSVLEQLQCHTQVSIDAWPAYLSISVLNSSTVPTRFDALDQTSLSSLEPRAASRPPWIDEIIVYLLNHPVYWSAKMKVYCLLDERNRSSQQCVIMMSLSTSMHKCLLWWMQAMRPTLIPLSVCTNQNAWSRPISYIHVSFCPHWRKLNSISKCYLAQCPSSSFWSSNNVSASCLHQYLETQTIPVVYLRHLSPQYQTARIRVPAISKINCLIPIPMGWLSR